MASRAAKDVPVREKSGKSPSPSPSNLGNTDPAQRRRSPHPPSLDHPHHQKPISAPSDHKINAPNYLRPTVSSRTDTSKNNSATKKPSTTTSPTDTSHKSTINRRRSLDNKPPPPSHQPKTHTTSPTPTPVEKNPRPISSTKAKTTSSLTKPLPEKAAKAFSKDVGKPHTLYSRPVKNVKKNTNTTTTTTTSAAASNSNSTTKKHNSTSTNALATKAPISTNDRSANIEDTPKHEPLQEAGIEPLVTEPEEEELASNERSNDGLPTEVLTMEDKEHVDIPPAEAHQPEEIEESEEEVKKLSNSSTVSEKEHTTPVPEEKNANHVVEMEETEPEEIHIDGPEIEDKEVEEESKDEINDHKNHQEEESFESEPIAVVDNENKNGGGGGGEQSGIQLEKPEEKGLEEKEEVKDEGKKGSEAEHDTQKVEELVSKEVKPEGKEVVMRPEEANKINLVSRPQVSKKDNTAYNDVIEETASKLREQRRNKVKALVGAFETVISLEDPEAETSRGN